MSFAKNGSLGIMQPYFFPYWGHFCLIASTQKWAVFDTPQYTPRSWMNRNRVLHPTKGWQYLTVPLSNSSINISLKDATLVSNKRAAQELTKKLDHYHKRAPYFDACMKVFAETFNSVRDNRLVSLNVASLSSVCSYLDIPFNYRFVSEMNVDLPKAMEPGQWAPMLTEHLGATTYINPIAGRELFEDSDFLNAGISLRFLEHDDLTYACEGYIYQPSLSIIDAMMWVPPIQLSEFIQTRYQIR